MTASAKGDLVTASAVAKQIGCTKGQLDYHFRVLKAIPGVAPKLIGGVRHFTKEDIARIKAYFASLPKGKVRTDTKASKIRAFLLANPGAANKDCMDALREQGIIVNSGQVTLAKTDKFKLKLKKLTDSERFVWERDDSDDSDFDYDEPDELDEPDAGFLGVDEIFLVKKLVELVGGFENAQAAIALIQRIGLGKAKSSVEFIQRLQING